MSEHDRNTYQVVPAPSFLVIGYTVHELNGNVLAPGDHVIENVLAIGYPAFPAADYHFNETPAPVFLTATGWICHGLCDEGRRYVSVSHVTTRLEPV